MAKRITRIDGPGSFQQAELKARFGHKDWIAWTDASGPHAAVKTIESVKEMIAAKPRSWALVMADSGTAMKGYDWLASNILKQMEMGIY